MLVRQVDVVFNSPKTNDPEGIDQGRIAMASSNTLTIIDNRTATPSLRP